MLKRKLSHLLEEKETLKAEEYKAFDIKTPSMNESLSKNDKELFSQVHSILKSKTNSHINSHETFDDRMTILIDFVNKPYLKFPNQSIILLDFLAYHFTRYKPKMYLRIFF